MKVAAVRIGGKDFVVYKLTNIKQEAYKLDFGKRSGKHALSTRVTAYRALFGSKRSEYHNSLFLN